MAKTTKHTDSQEFSTKEFNVYFPFDAKAATCPDCGENPCKCEGEDSGKILKITGWANFSGDLDNEASIFVDHSGDVIVPSGFDLKTWNKNPQILWQHDRNYTIGKGLKAVKKKEGLEITAEIHEKAMEEEDFYKVEKGLVTMLSVGFRTLAGEYKEVNKRNVFFITKALLYEVSVVSIPCNSESGFSIVKSLGDGNFYAGDFDSTPNAVPGAGATHKSIEDNYMKMQIKLRDMLSEDKVKELEDLGLGESLDELKDVDAKAYLESLVAKQLAEVKAEVAELRAELTKAAEAPAEGETKEEEKPAASEEESKADDEANVETKEDDQEVVSKSLTETSSAVANLLALYTAE